MAHSEETVFSGLEGSHETRPLLRDDHEKQTARIKGCNGTHDREKVIDNKWRNYIGFWLLGISNNFPYVVMLSSAYDILGNLSDDSGEKANGDYNSSCILLFNDTTNTSSFTPRECLPHGTYLVLLADIIPTFIIKLVFPYFMHYIPYWIRMICVVAFAAASFITVALGTNIAIVLMGVACASVSSGLGEITFLALTARYDRFTVAGWSSGTGAAGLAGSLAYTGFSTFLSLRDSLLIQLVMPCVLFLSYVFVITKPKKIDYKIDAEVVGRKDSKSSNLKLEGNSIKQKRQFKLELFRKSELSVYEHLKFIPYLLVKYMVWLFLVYVAEYMINQSLFESLYYPNTHIGQYCFQQNVQYKWYQVMYQIGVFFSRSSLTLFRIKYFHIMSLLQVLNFVLLFLEVIFQVVPSFWITLFFVLYEGFLGGAVYANAFYAISKNVDPAHREFSMGVASVADSTGIVTAGLVSYFIHEFICSLGY